MGLRPCGTAAAAHFSLLASRLSCITPEECSPSTSLEAQPQDNLVLIKICCSEQEGHNDGLRFQSENICGTTAGDQKPSVSQGNMLTLGGGRKSSPRLLLGVVIRIFHRLIEKSCHLFTDRPVHTHPTFPLVCFQISDHLLGKSGELSLAVCHDRSPANGLFIFAGKGEGAGELCVTKSCPQAVPVTTVFP